MVILPIPPPPPPPVFCLVLVLTFVSLLNCEVWDLKVDVIDLKLATGINGFR